MKTCLIIGGTSGLGLELAERLRSDYRVVITGRTNPRREGLRFERLDLAPTPGLGWRVGEIVKRVGHIDMLIYAPGYYKEGTITDLSIEQIEQIKNVVVNGADFAVRKVLLEQGELECYVAITSTSQTVPRYKEPVYAEAKAALGMSAKSLSLDPRIKKTLVAAPSGMATKFWDGTGRDTSDMLDPAWVAERILGSLEGEFSYREVQYLREPARVELVSER